MAERVGGSEFCTLPKFRTPTLSALPRTIGVLPLSLSLRPTGRTSSAMKCAFIVARHLRLYLSGDVSGLFRRPSPPAVSVARHPGRTSSATFRAVSVARHLRQHISGDVSGRFRRPSPPAAHLRRHFGPFPLPVTSCSTSPATFRGISVARHLRPHAPATFLAVSVARHLRQHIFGDVSGHFRCQSPPAAHLRRRFGPFPLPGTSGRKSPATFPAFSVARHLRPFPLPVTPAAHPRRRFGPFLSPVTSGRFRRPSPPAARSGDVFGHFRCSSPPAVPLRRHFGPFPLPVTPAAHLRRRFWPFPLLVTSGSTSSATFRAVSVARHLRQYLFGDVSERFRRPSPRQ